METEEPNSRGKKRKINAKEEQENAKVKNKAKKG